MLRKLQPNFQHYVKKIEAQAKIMVFLYKNVYNSRLFFLISQKYLKSNPKYLQVYIYIFEFREKMRNLN